MSPVMSEAPNELGRVGFQVEWVDEFRERRAVWFPKTHEAGARRLIRRVTRREATA